MPTCESLWLKVKLDSFTVVIVGIYRPEYTTIENNAKIFQTLLSLKFDRIVVFGDFNFKDINWTNPTMQSMSMESSLFYDDYVQSNFFQLVDFFTRFRVNQTPSTLDLVFTSQENILFDIKALPPIGVSDHNIITAAMQVCINIKSVRNVFTRNYIKADLNKLNLYY